MARGFKWIRSLNKSYEQQGAIFFACLSYERQTEWTKRKIRRLCRDVGGEHERALFAFLTTRKSWEEVTMEYHLSDATLHRLRRRFYEKW